MELRGCCLSGKVCGSNGRGKWEFLGSFILNQEHCAVGPWNGKMRCCFLLCNGVFRNRTLSIRRNVPRIFHSSSDLFS